MRILTGHTRNRKTGCLRVFCAGRKDIRVTIVPTRKQEMDIHTLAE